jgi:hypothetical protein
MIQRGHDSDWWSITAIHEASHGIAAFALGCQPVDLELNRRAKNGDTSAGTCFARYEVSLYGKIAKIFVGNAPFTASQHEVLPCGDKGDLHERQEAFTEFCKMFGGDGSDADQKAFDRLIDTPSIAFFADVNIQAATLALATMLYTKNKLSIKQSNYWRGKLEIPEAPCVRLSKVCLQIAETLAG